MLLRVPRSNSGKKIYRTTFFTSRLQPLLAPIHGFGIRVLEDRCFVVIQIEGGQPVFGHPHQIPLQLEILPSHVRMVIDNHVLNYPASDLIDVLTRKKSFQEALDSPAQIEAKRTTDRAERHKHAS